MAEDKDKNKTDGLEDECVTQTELRAFMRNITDTMTLNNNRTARQLEGIERRISGIVDRLEALETRLPPADHDRDERATRNEEERRRLRFNRTSMGGNNDNNDPFAKIKFTIPAFYGAYDAEVYLDWEMMVEQKFNSHLVPDIHQVRQATCELKDFTIIWWNELVKSGQDPQTRDRLKLAMRSRFVPPSYKRDLCKKLQRLEQATMSVQDYYQELQKGMLRCGVVEDNEDMMVHSMGDLIGTFRI